jgi:hypothetical protein
MIVKQLRDTESKSSCKAPYEGLIEYEATAAEIKNSENIDKLKLPFGVTGLVEPKSYLQVGDKVVVTVCDGGSWCIMCWSPGYISTGLLSCDPPVSCL